MEKPGDPQRQEADLRPLVYVIEDDANLLVSIEGLLGSAGFAVQSFEAAAEFLRRTRSEAPCCLLLDVNLPGTSGLELQDMLARSEPGLPIVFITAHADIRMSVRAIKAGAVEFLPKPFLDQDLLRAVEVALERARAGQRKHGELRELQERYAALTPRERQVLAGVVRGLLNKQVAHELGISEVTVKVHRGQVMHKMKATSLPELVRMCVHLGLDLGDARS